MTSCAKCKKLLKSNYITALGKAWHPHCFTCRSCKKKILSKEFITFDDQAFHKECLKCPGCRKAIDGQYMEHEHMPWHPLCYQKQFSKLCSVCRNPLTRRYYVDFWGNEYCSTHNHYTHCASCSRIVCKNLTDGGMQYPDGVTICNLCGLHGVATQERAENLMGEMRQSLASVGLKLNSTQTPIHLCGRDELNEASRHGFHENRPILGLARWTISSRQGKIISRNFRDILIQINLPEEHFRTVAIHELTHAWFFYNHYQDMPLEVEEGMCVLMEYIWLKSQKTQDAKYRMQTIEESPDPVYGDGFRAAKDSLKLMPLDVLLTYLKEKNKFPTKLTAFFYH
ncbi:hypothetical protein ACH42_03625 [Endozoicomonas sp. (ex Bugula neritina AB1)]|nr:hypothetical protein ACH42_03625 [Endozoicomonas sp. (ex Bugula neritina AB1)]